MNRVRALLCKYRDIIPYLFFGVCTTMVNVVVYWCCAHPLKMSIMLSTVIAWILAVFFAYITNRKWVFKSEANTREKIAREMISFFGCRITTGIADWLCMFVFVELLEINDVVIKAVANILVIILNYVASKLFVFRKGNNH